MGWVGHVDGSDRGVHLGESSGFVGWVDPVRVSGGSISLVSHVEG